MSRTVRGSLSFSPRVSKRNFKEERDEKWWLKKVRGEINAAAPMLSHATPPLLQFQRSNALTLKRKLEEFYTSSMNHLEQRL